jgi:hypothetical protein
MDFGGAATAARPSQGARCPAAIELSYDQIN